jgi:hypothetical protein
MSRTLRSAAIAVHALIALNACGGGGGAPDTEASNPTSPPSSSPPPETPPPASPPPVQTVDHGRYVGTVTIDDRAYFGDALFAVNGETHLYIGGPYGDTGAIQLASRAGSIDFVAPARTPSGNTISGGVIGREGQDWGEPGSPSHRWCGRASSAQMSMYNTSGGDTGAIHGEITGHGETWTFDLAPWSNYYNMPAHLSSLAGQYTELVAPFAQGGTVLTIDEDGRAFFQGSLYLCTGNGTFAPLGDGESNVYTVEMSISNCEYPYIQYDGEYRGLATLSPSDYWAHDTNVRIWLASFSPDWSAVTMWGRKIPGS